MKQEQAEIAIVKMWIHNGIFLAYFKPKATIDINAAKEILDTRIALCNGKTRPALIDVTNLLSISKEARDYLASEAGRKYINAAAIIVNSAVQKIMGNIFLKVHPHPFPTKIFKTQEEGLTWLEQYKIEN